MKILTGHPFYGQHIGVLVFDQLSPRIPGDAGHSGSFEYPIRYQVVEGSFSDLIEGSEKIKKNLIDACKKLKNEGIKGVVGDCGMMSLYQQEMAGESGLPVIASSLNLIPFVWETIGRKGKIGIVTGHSQLLKERHLRASGWTDDMDIVLQGLEDEAHFSEIVINGGLDLNPDLMEKDILNAVGKLVNDHKDTKAIIMECSNIGSFSKSVYESYEIPVFDIISAANILHYSVNPKKYY